MEDIREVFFTIRILTHLCRHLIDADKHPAHILPVERGSQLRHTLIHSLRVLGTALVVDFSTDSTDDSAFREVFRQRSDFIGCDRYSRIIHEPIRDSPFIILNDPF